MYQQNTIHQHWLELILADVDAIAGTVHIQRGADLYLSAALNIPPAVIGAVAHLPQGKGMAGLAQTRKIPVQSCDLQSDTTGNIRPGAQAVAAHAAIALPVLDATQEVKAVVGLAWSRSGAIEAAEERMLMSLVAGFPGG